MRISDGSSDVCSSDLYFEFDAQPAMITPYTPSEVIASRYSRPALAFDSASCASNGTTAHAANAGTSVISGARMYSTRCALVGWMTSLNSSLNTSAKAWNTPRPTYIGPWRTCIQPSSLRSQTT